MSKKDQQIFVILTQTFSCSKEVKDYFFLVNFYSNFLSLLAFECQQFLENLKICSVTGSSKAEDCDQQNRVSTSQT